MPGLPVRQPRSIEIISKSSMECVVFPGYGRGLGASRLRQASAGEDTMCVATGCVSFACVEPTWPAWNQNPASPRP